MTFVRQVISIPCFVLSPTYIATYTKYTKYTKYDSKSNSQQNMTNTSQLVQINLKTVVGKILTVRSDLRLEQDHIKTIHDHILACLAGF